MTTINDAQTHGYVPENGALSRLFNPRIVTFLFGILPQFDGSPGVQALLLGLLSIASGTTLNLLTWSVRSIKCPLPRPPNVLSPEAAKLE
jgi:threonine/homoserine/homoserine lactone efflux protein